MASGTITCSACGTGNRVPRAASGHPVCGRCKAPLPWLVTADGESFDAAVDTSTLVVVDLWAPWCGPCHAIAPALEELAARRAGKVKVVKVNVDASPDLSARFGVQSIPTLLLFRKGKLLDRTVGALPAPALDRWVTQHLDAAA